MLLLHAGLIAGRFVVWGETEAVAKKGVAGRASRAKHPAATPSPWNVGSEQLLAALNSVLAEPRSSALRCENILVWLPTVKDAPVPSSPILAPPPEGEVVCVLAPWQVSGVALSWEQAIALLCACAGRDTLESGVLIGNTLFYWATAMRFAGALVARQQYLPGLEKADDGYVARWRPVLAGSEADAASALARAMPGACRALSTEADTLPETPAIRILADFLAETCDTLVRSAPAQSLFLPAAVTPTARKPKATVVFDSLHDQWLSALRSPDGRMHGEAKDLADFAAQVQEWRRPLFLSLAAPFRLCFRLEEPLLAEEEEEMSPSSDASWYVRYLLQSVEDPSLFVPVADAWSKKGVVTSLLRRDDFQPREFLLTALGQASKICPEIEASLKSAAPDGYALKTAGAQEFLTEKAWMLEQAGFVVQFPAWWTRKGTKNRLTAKASVKSPAMTSLAGLSLDTIVEFQWEAALGDVTLTREELEALARQKVALVRVRGQWVQLDPEEIEAALAFWGKQKQDAVSLRQVMRMALGAERAPGGLAIEDVEASGWLAEWLARLNGSASLEPLPAPEGFHGALRPYQQRGYEWLRFLGQWGLGACLADDMGLGKTAQTLAFLGSQWKEDGKRPALVICPTSVVGNWHREAQRFSPDLPVMVHHGLTRTKGDDFRKEAEAHGLVLSSYALLHRDLELLQEVPWSGIVLDEAQNIKNPETKQSKAARALQADWRIALSGTPVENHVGDLWAILEFLNPGFLGSQAEFKRNFYFPIQANHDPDAAERLKRITRPFILRRLKTDRTIIADLPDKIEAKMYCTLTPEQASLYQAVVKEMTEHLDEAEGIQRRGMVLATLTKLKQICNHPAQFLGDNSQVAGRSGKLARLTEMLEEALSAGDKALIFTQFTEMGEIIRKHLQERFGREVLFLHGGVSKKERDRMVERFQTEGPATLPFFLLSLKAGGVGLNLTAASHVFHFDRWWNPAVENQATDRAFRIGQKKNVQVHKFLCAGTLEEKIDALIEGKREIAANVVGTGEGWLTELSTAELKDLFTLRQDALDGAE
ncbi:MAG: rapA 2 [Chthonomonadaceae bacterium]|nr:rapA 2 [Chthonomonadaceae bacterium]